MKIKSFALKSLTSGKFYGDPCENEGRRGRKRVGGRDRFLEIPSGCSLRFTRGKNEDKNKFKQYEKNDDES